MAKAGYSVSTTAVVALSAATPRTILGVAAPAQFGVDLIKMSVGFDGVTASAVPALVELCAATWATNPPGTASTSRTVTQQYGRAVTPGFTAASAWTTEPTVLTVIREWLLTPAGGLLVYDFPFGTSPDSPASAGFALRVTSPAAVGVRADLTVERC
ncbi:MAG: hypothetical protein ACRCZP_19135 [Phycicoccus sp.]